MAHVPQLDPVLLWPAGAPGAGGEGKEDQPRLTPYLPTSSKPAPAMVICPGGGYKGRSHHVVPSVVSWLASLGAASLVLDYRVAPYRHPIPLTDAQRAIRLVRHHAADWSIDPHRVGVMGFSAGGHLAGSAATIFDEGDPQAPDPIDRLPCRPDVLVACYPVITFGPFGHRGSCRNLLGDQPDPALREYLGLENRVTERTPPTFLWHTNEDAVVPVENVLLMAGALARAKVPYALHVFPRGEHGCGLAEGVSLTSAWPGLCGAWLGQVGFIDA